MLVSFRTDSRALCEIFDAVACGEEVIVMNALKKPIGTELLHVGAVLFALVGTVCAQDLNSRLSKRATFTPKSAGAFDQLVEVSQYYQVPMAIELASDTVMRTSIRADPAPRGARALLTTILRGCPDCRMETLEGVVHFYDRRFVADQRNFLNLRIPDFRVSNASLFDADASLRLAIKMLLYPERYARGWNGGHGSPHTSGFDRTNITISGRNLTVREILTKIVAGNGDALWVVRLAPSGTMINERFFAQAYTTPLAQDDFIWQFIPVARDPGHK
jgi:hypothetical protein